MSIRRMCIKNCILSITLLDSSKCFSICNITAFFLIVKKILPPNYGFFVPKKEILEAAQNVYKQKPG
jgi:hypothetical protein